MDCREFELLTKDFIFDNISELKKVEEYLNHAKNCPGCKEDLDITYSLHRALGDIKGPDGTDDSADYPMELKEIVEYYEYMILKQNKMSKLKKIVVVAFFIVIILVAICLWL